MNLTATHINYYQICKRKLWLFANGINMEHTSDMVYDGKLLHETSYPQRAERYEEMLISAEYEGVSLFGKIDYFNARNNTVHETKRSDKVEEAHVRQLKFYLWLLELNGVEDATGLLEYPRLRKTDEVFLDDKDREQLKKSVSEIKKLVESDTCPSVINAKICKSCSYFDFCYAEE
ncbi:MAG: CRISPR-associated protein Cas4 [Tissierellia bacterium]|nr:CRISPR-associated protein Cas4 [Proteiniphilum sp.]MDD4437414.1 CRISPR-associated protein Cas4 [Tissierellia bacterium]